MLNYIIIRSSLLDVYLNAHQKQILVFIYYGLLDNVVMITILNFS